MLNSYLSCNERPCECNRIIKVNFYIEFAVCTCITCAVSNFSWMRVFYVFLEVYTDRINVIVL